MGSIPVDAKGKKLYEQAPIESTINAIYNNPDLDEEEADALVEAKIAGATKRIAQLEKKKPKMGEDEDAYIAQRAKWREQLEAEQASLAYWQGVQSAVPEVRRRERGKNSQSTSSPLRDPSPISQSETDEALSADGDMGEISDAAEGATNGSAIPTEEESATDGAVATETQDVEEQTQEETGVFGRIYRQFKGKAKEAFTFLAKVKGGDALGVFSREGIGEIDLVWGDEKGGLAHIISKHIGEDKSFSSVEDAQKVISEIIENGEIVFENGDKVVISKDNKIVTLRKNYREKGKKIAEKNWILTAYDETKADGTSAISGTNQGQAAQPTKVSEGKDTTNFRDLSESMWKITNFLNNRYGYSFWDGMEFYNWLARKLKNKKAIRKWIADKLPAHLVNEVVETIFNYGEALANRNASNSVESNDVAQEEAGELTTSPLQGTPPISQSETRGELETQSQATGELSEEDRQSGQLVKATLKVGDRQVYVIEGDVVTNEDGSIDVDETTESLVVKDVETGAVEMIDPHVILSVEVVDSSQFTIKNSQLGSQPQVPTAVSQGSTEATAPTPTATAGEDLAPVYSLNDEVRIVDSEGNELTGVVVEEENADGDVLVEVGGRVLPISKGELDAMQGGEEDNSQLEIINSQATPSPLRGTPPKQGSGGELGSIPVDAKGEPMYESAPVEATIADIYNDPDLDEEEADAFVQAKIDGATKRIAQLEKKKPKMGESMAAFKSAKAKWQEQLGAEQKSLAYWQGVQGAVPEVRRKERARQQMEADLKEQEKRREERVESARRAEERGRNRGDYRKAIAGWDDAPGSFHEYVAQALLVGDHKMRWNDNGLTRGLGSHTTGRRGVNRRGEVVTARNEEARAMSWLIDDRTGLSPEALADRLWNDYSGSYGEEMQEGNPLDVLLDVVTSMPTPQSMWEYVKGEHDARMEAERGGSEQQYSEEEIEAMERDAMYREKYGVSEEEYWAREAELEERGERREEKDRHDEVRDEEIADARAIVTEAVITSLEGSGIEVVQVSDAEAQEILHLGGVEMSAKKKRALETVSVQEAEHQQTAISSADGAKVLNNLDNLAEEYDKNPKTEEKTFVGVVADALGIEAQGKSSKYATFETKNGKVVTIRLSNHNATVSNFDNNGEADGISIVVSAKGNIGITNDGDAHIVEYYYDAIKLRRAEGKPLADIVRSIKQALYSGEFTDTTGLAERQEVNLNEVEPLRTPQGVVYGWTDGKKVYLTKEGMNPETPVHEYTHLWARAMMQGNAEGWQSVKDLLRDTPVWNEVMSDANYADIRENEDAVASECLARLSGRENARRMEAEAQKMLSEANGIMEKANAVTLIERMKRALREFWNWVGKNLFDIKSFGSIDEVTDRVLWDLIENSELKIKNSESQGVEKQIIGEQGASALDKAEEATHRLDNLGRARKMERYGYPAKAIRMATGWERGGDGKWRYEIEDARVKMPTREEAVKEYQSATMREREAQNKWEAIANRVIPSLPRASKNNTPEENEAIRKRRAEANKQEKELFEQLNKARDYRMKLDNQLRDGLYVKLTEVMDPNREVFKSYPALKDITVMIAPSGRYLGTSGYNGYYDVISNTIYINWDLGEEAMKSTLLHEVQHAIQEIEGFALGGNTQSVATRADELKAEVSRLYEMMLSTPEWGEWVRLTNRWLDHGDKSVEPRIQEIEDSGVLRAIRAEQDRLRKKYGNYRTVWQVIDNIYSMDSEVWEHLPDWFFDKYDAYRALGGEVESRNVQARMGYTPEQRRAKLLSETEDVARADQKFIMGNGGVSAMGSRVEKRMAEIASHFDGKEMTKEQRAAADVYSGKGDNLTISAYWSKIVHKSVIIN